MVVKLEATFQDHEKLYFLMQNLPHGELAQYMSLKPTLPLEQIKFIAANIILCLEVIHAKGIVHRDLKPENLVFNDKNKLTLIDFGTADV